MIARPRNVYAHYHAHVYFGPDTAAQARTLCERVGEQFDSDVRVGRLHEKPVGPHPHWSCQLAFDSAQFDAVIRWLEQNRSGLDVLVHGLTGDDLADHTLHASWLGSPVKLNLAMFGG